MKRHELALIDIFITRLQCLSIVDEVWLDTTEYYHPLIKQEYFDKPKIKYKDPTLVIVLKEGIYEEQEEIYKELLEEIIIQFKNGSEGKYTKLNYRIMNKNERDKYMIVIVKKFGVTPEEFKSLVRFDNLLINNYINRYGGLPIGIYAGLDDTYRYDY